MSIEKWEHFFKPEVRSTGQSLFAQGKVSISQTSDTDVVVYVRTMPPPKVTLKSRTISSGTLMVDCNCPSGKKKALCKHIWAGLLATYEKNPDFLEEKTQIESAEPTSKESERPQSARQSQIREQKEAEFKEKQKSYRKEQYQKQKQRLKNFKKNKKDDPPESKLPEEVETALEYFAQNGFEFRENLNEDVLGKAKKTLSRIFHPDSGGTHEEMSELNKHSNTLIKFAKY